MKLTFPYIFKANKTQKEIIEDIMWHCEKVYNTLKLSISKEMQEKFKVKSLNFLIPRKLKKLVNFSAIKMIKIRKDRENKYKMEMIYEREEKRTEGTNVMAIDLGLDNLAACTNMNNNINDKVFSIKLY